MKITKISTFSIINKTHKKGKGPLGLKAAQIGQVQRGGQPMRKTG
jgi:hypothetical protein